MDIRFFKRNASAIWSIIVAAYVVWYLVIA